MDLKRKILAALLLMSLSVTAHGEELTPYSGTRLFWDISTRVTVFSSGGYARIIRLHDGRLMAVASNGTGIIVAYSSNNGLNWTAAQTIAPSATGYGNCNAEVIQLADGTIIIGYNIRPTEPYSSERNFGIRCRRSLDNGSTWGDEIFVYDASYTFDNGCWEPSFLELPSGELQIYYSDEGVYLSSNEQNISVCRSFDKGLTWSTPDMVSFRAGYRDGMAKALLLSSGDTIVVSIEDNGWEGVGGMFPTIVRCPLSDNWHSGYVDGNSKNRNKTLDFTFCPTGARGGAPYICMLPSGEIVLSYQSPYGLTDNRDNMFVAVGNKYARNFKSLQHPFRIGESDYVKWNSVCLLDSSTVAAVGSINDSKVEMIKAYALEVLQAPYSSPVVNANYSFNKGYLRSASNQISLGVETGDRIIADFAYDDDSLYFFARVADRTVQAIAGSYGDGVTLYLDTKNRSAQLPLTGEYRIFFRRDSTYTMAAGSDDNKRWTVQSVSTIHYAARDTHGAYFVEAAIPWTALGFSKAPIDQKMRANIRVQDNQGSTSNLQYETIPDATVNASWTWMELQLLSKITDGIGSVPVSDRGKFAVTLTSDGNGNISVVSQQPLSAVALFSPDGTLLAQSHVKGNSCTLKAPWRGVVIVRCTLSDGTALIRKIIME